MCIKTVDKRKLLAYTNFMVSLQKDTIRNKGLRVTPARIAVLRILEESQKPVDIATIYAEIAKHHVDADQATIYRIIDNFLEKNLITRIQFQEKKFFYEAKRPEHHHAICNECGKIEDISNCSIKRTESRIKEKTGFTVKSHSLEFFGICADCIK